MILTKDLYENLHLSRSTDHESGSFWCQDHPVVEKETRAVVRGGMLSHQQEWWLDPAFCKVLVGGYGSGKTMIGCKRIIAVALENAPLLTAAVSPTYKMARHTVVAMIKDLLDGKRSLYAPREFWWRYFKTTFEFIIRFRGREARIQIYSGEDPAALRGPNLAAAYIDEPFIQSVDVFKQMLARVRHPEARLREITMTGTPEQLNWGYDLCEGTYDERFKVGVIQASTRDNPTLPPDYVERLASVYADKEAQAYIEGKFINLSEGQVYYPFNKDNNVTEEEPPEDVEFGAGMDFNVNPMSAVVFWRAGDRIHFFDEFELPNSDTEFMCAILREKYGDQLIEIYPDATGSARKTAAPGGKSDFWFIKQAGYEIEAPHQNPKRRDRYNAVNSKLKNGSITISEKCRNLIRYLMDYSYDTIKRQKNMSHLLDAFSYPVAFMFPVNKELLDIVRVKGY